MGICASQEDKTLAEQNAKIESQLKADKQKAQTEIKMLLLGAGESGKSTILKQMTLLHGGGYSDAERESFKEIIYTNIVQSMKVMLEASKTLGIALGNAADNQKHADTINNLPAQIEGDTMPAEVSAACKALWADSGIQATYGRANEYQLNDSTKYYFDAIDRICAADFKPTDQDVLRSRVKTTGITETTFHIAGYTYRMFDVGGQRSERKKWIHCFENVTAILFLVAVSEYDQKLVEDESVNRMQEALTLFESICNSRWFQKTSMILFLNKIDKLKDKIKYSPIGKYFPDYVGGDNYDAACAYFQEKFTSLNQSPTKQVYTHFTCATDTNQIAFVMAAVRDIIIQNSLRDVGLM